MTRMEKMAILHCLIGLLIGFLLVGCAKPKPRSLCWAPDVEIHGACVAPWHTKDVK